MTSERILTCEQARECLFAFLDNELDGPLSIEIQRHLEHCPMCAREVEIERTIRRRLESVLAPEPAGGADDEASFEDAVRRVIGAPHRVEQPRRRLLVGAVIAASAAVFYTGYSAWRYVGAKAGDAVADMLVADFEHFLEKGKPLQLASAEPATLSAWLHEATGLSVSLPGIDDAQGQIVGARKCKLAGRPAAFALYEMNGTPASLIVMPAEGIDLEAMQQVRDGPHMHWMDRRDGHTVLACKRGDLLYAAVSTLGEDRLAVLMTDGTPRD